MSGDTHSRRAAFAKAVALRCSTDARFASYCRARDRRGNRVVVPLLSSDTVDLACRFVVQSGGEGTLVILDETTDGDDRSNTAMATIKVRYAVPGSAGPCVPFDANLTLADLMKILAPGVSLGLERRELGGGSVSLDGIGRTEIDRGFIAAGH